MDNLQDEIRQLKEFVTFLKDDRQAAKDKEQREAWTKYASVTIVALAVLAAVATQWSGKYSSRVATALNESNYQLTKATDLWGYFQAKSIKKNLYEIAAAQTAGVLGGDAATAARDFKEKAAQYKRESEEVKLEAEAASKLSDEARARAAATGKYGARMGYAIQLFQLAIALCSVTVLTKHKPLWYLSIATGVVGTAVMIYTWLS